MGQIQPASDPAPTKEPAPTKTDIAPGEFVNVAYLGTDDKGQHLAAVSGYALKGPEIFGLEGTSAKAADQATAIANCQTAVKAVPEIAAKMQAAGTAGAAKVS